MYTKTPHCLYINWLQIYDIKYIIFMNSTAAIFDLVTLEVAKKNATQLVLSLSHANAESSGNSLLTNNCHETCFYDIIAYTNVGTGITDVFSSRMDIK